MKNVVVLTEDGAFALFFRLHPGGFDSSRVPIPGSLPTKAKNVLMPGVSPGGGGGEALGAAGIDWWIIKIIQFSLNMGTMFFDIIVIPHDQLWAYYYLSTIWMTVKRNTWRH